MSDPLPRALAERIERVMHEHLVLVARFTLVVKPTQKQRKAFRNGSAALVAKIAHLLSPPGDTK